MVVMLVSAILWLVYSLLAGLIGFVVYTRASPRSDPPPPVSLLILLGLGGLAWVSALLSLCLNLGATANLLLLGLGVGAGFWQRKALRRYFQTRPVYPVRAGWLAWAAFIAFALVVCVKSSQAPQNYDTGLYHAQAIHWMETFPAVPGLGNLSDRLAFNSSWLLLSALTSASFLGVGSFHNLNGLLALLGCAFALEKTLEMWGAKRLTLAGLVSLSLPFLLRFIFSLEFSSPGTDLPAALFSWVVITLSLEKIEMKAEASRDFNFLAISLLAIFALTIKLSILPLLLLPIYFLARQCFGLAWGARMRLVGWAAAWTAILLIPWMARGWIQSGYLLYPIAQSSFLRPDWQIPLENALGTQEWIRSWARIPSPAHEAVMHMPFSQWVPAWYSNLLPLDRRILTVNALGLLSMLLFALVKIRRTGLRAAVLNPMTLLYADMLLGLAYWFTQAPAMRFGYAFLALFPPLCLAPWLLLAARKFPGLWRWSLLLAVICLLGYQVVSAARLARPVELRGIWALPAPYPAIETSKRQLGSLEIYLPLQGDQCWYTPLPCAPALDPAIHPRGTTLRQGFSSAPEEP